MVSKEPCVVCGAVEVILGAGVSHCRGCGAFQSSARLQAEWRARITSQQGADAEAERAERAALAFAACEWRSDWEVARLKSGAIARAVERFRTVVSQAGAYVDKRAAVEALAVVDAARRADEAAAAAWRGFETSRNTRAYQAAARAFWQAKLAHEDVAKLGDPPPPVDDAQARLALGDEDGEDDAG